MNVLQVISSSRTSGAEKHLVVLSEELLRRGHSVTAACPPGGWLSERLREAGVPTLELPMHGKSSPHAILELRRAARRDRVDVIHTHLTRATYMGYFAGVFANIPVVSSVHVWTRDFAYRWLPRYNHWFVAVSEYMRQSLISRGVPSNRIATVYNGTNICETDTPASGSALSVRAELSLPPDAEIVGVVSRVDDFKGQHILVEAAPAIVRRRPRAYFLFVGYAEPGYQQALWERAGEFGVADRLRFAGVRNDVPRLLSAMDVVAQPSVTENCSMTIIEAMAMGKPVVATRAGGNPELVVEPTTGVLIQRNHEELASAVIALLDDPGRMSDMGAAARSRARAMFSAPSMAASMESFYHRALRRRLTES